MSEHFDVVDGVIIPKPYMQHRPVARASAPSVSRAYSPSGGGNKDDLVHTVVVSWTNETPASQWVDGWVTRGGAQVGLQARSRGYLADFHGFLISATKPADTAYELFEVSRSGVGMDAGRGGMLAVGSGFGVARKREAALTAPFMPHSPGRIRVAAGETLWCRVDVRFRSEFWENTSIDGGSSSTESGFISGDTTIELRAAPAMEDPGPRPTPTIVGVTSDRKVSGLFSETPTVVAKPAGTAVGDILLAVVTNQWGLIGDVAPVQEGWTQIRAVDGGWQDVHMRVFWRVVVGGEPASFSFTNAIAAEQITHLIGLRDTSLMLDDGWYVASALRDNWWERRDGHVALSIDRNGQLLLCVSYVAHALSQSPVTQVQPAGMTEISEVAGSASTISIAALDNPPRPTAPRSFTVSKKPVWSGHSITLTILVPGTKPSDL